VSCSLHDVIALEARGVPAVAIGTDVFVAEAREQALALAMPEQRLITVPHPIQPTPITTVQSYADTALAEAVAWLIST
jgi:hypothetical protein